MHLLSQREARAEAEECCPTMLPHVQAQHMRYKHEFEHIWHLMSGDYKYETKVSVADDSGLNGSVQIYDTKWVTVASYYWSHSKFRTDFVLISFLDLLYCFDNIF